MIEAQTMITNVQKLEPMILAGVVYLFKSCVNVFCYYITNQKIIIPKWKEIPNL